MRHTILLTSTILVGLGILIIIGSGIAKGYGYDPNIDLLIYAAIATPIAWVIGAIALVCR